MKTLKDLDEWVNNNFSVAIGVPRAYMEWPAIRPDGTWYIHRERYAVLSIGAKGKRKEWEERLVLAMQHTLHAARVTFYEKYYKKEYNYSLADCWPLMFVRKPLEFNEGPGNKCSIYFRFLIPGLDLSSLPYYKAEGKLPKILEKVA